MIEGWGLAAAAVVAGGAIIGSTISSGAQSSAAQTAANAQEQAANLQATTQASTANAELGLEAPTRELGGMAQQQLAYELGLSPNLDISSDFETPQVNTNGQTSWVPNSDLTGNPTLNSANPVNIATYAPTGTITNGAQAQPGLNNTNNTVPNVNGAGINAPSVSQGTVPGATAVNPGSPTGGVQTNATGPNTAEGGYGSLTENPFQNPANLTLSPAYQFDLSQGESVLNNQEAASGHSPVSTGTETAEQQYVQGLALNTYDTAFNQAQSEQQMDYNELAATAGEAQIGNSSATGSLESAGAGISGAQGASGSAAAAGAIGQGNAITSGIGTALSGLSGLSNPYLYGTGSSGLNLGTSSPASSPYTTGFSSFAGSSGYDPTTGAFSD